jgi:hypothetical protein
VLIAGRIDLSSTRYGRADKEMIFQQFDQQIIEELRTGMEIQLIQLLTKKIGGTLTYQRDDNHARVIFSIPLVHPPDLS